MSVLIDFLGLPESLEGKDAVCIDGICIDKYISKLIVELNKIGLRTAVSCSGLNEDHISSFDNRHDGYILIVLDPSIDMEVLEAFINIAVEEGFSIDLNNHMWLRRQVLRIGTVSESNYSGPSDYDNDKLRKAQWDALLNRLRLHVCDPVARKIYLLNAEIAVSVDK